MKLYLSIYFIVCLFAFPPMSLKAQTTVEAIKIDEFGKLNCGDLLARIDNLYINLQKDPDASAIVVIHPQKGLIEKARFRKRFIENVLLRRSFDLSRLKIIRGTENDSESGEMYLVPLGAGDPVKEMAAWQEEKLDLSSPIVFGSETEDDPCPDFPFPRYAEIIRSNSNLRGHVVIFSNSLNNRNALMKEWLKVLTVDHKIPKKQLRFFFGKPHVRSYTEFWVVPVKKK